MAELGHPDLSLGFGVLESERKRMHAFRAGKKNGESVRVSGWAFTKGGKLRS